MDVTNSNRSCTLLTNTCNTSIRTNNAIPETIASSTFHQHHNIDTSMIYDTTIDTIGFQRVSPKRLMRSTVKPRLSQQSSRRKLQLLSREDSVMHMFQKKISPCPTTATAPKTQPGKDEERCNAASSTNLTKITSIEKGTGNGLHLPKVALLCEESTPKHKNKKDIVIRKDIEFTPSIPQPESSTLRESDEKMIYRQPEDIFDRKEQKDNSRSRSARNLNSRGGRPPKYNNTKMLVISSTSNKVSKNKDENDDDVTISILSKVDQTSPSTSDPSAIPLCDSSNDHFQDIKQRRRLSVIRPINDMIHQTLRSMSQPNLFAPSRERPTAVTKALLSTSKNDSTRRGIFRSRSTNVCKPTTNISNPPRQTKHVDKSLQRVRFLLPKNKSSRSTTSVLTKATSRDNAAHLMDQLLDHAIKKAYFYTKKERKNMKADAAIVVESYIEEHPQIIFGMKQFYIDCHKSNNCDDSKLIALSTAMGDNDTALIKKICKTLSQTELKILKEWCSSDVRGLEDLMLPEHSMFNKERSMAVHSVLAYQEYYLQQQAEWNTTTATTTKDVKNYSPSNPASFDSSNSSTHDCSDDVDSVSKYGYDSDNNVNEDRDTDVKNRGRNNTVVVSPPTTPASASVQYDHFQEAMRNRSLSVSKRSREFALKIAIGDRIEAMKYLTKSTV